MRQEDLGVAATVCERGLPHRGIPNFPLLSRLRVYLIRLRRRFRRCWHSRRDWGKDNVLWKIYALYERTGRNVEAELK